MNDNGKLSNYNIRERTKVRYQEITTNLKTNIKLLHSSVSPTFLSFPNPHTITQIQFLFDNHKRINKYFIAKQNTIRTNCK